ncbi:MBL fold metallo-hydrolase [Allokutzneria sp. A3M-2-11 16]|uniref:MBL fold metallo-hydrolase n=1 Tax=Allokutzneria sp. A3M-2-11 16 TaxID=2962043 RepID=UPI0020B6FB32|nr:MBL fold metallo-hydrolase [Allokutzneria sp. A3M-2-11 16]MCP3801080.1 MBL fold metallo-hydrolase [Allokutzneria sp. A3M-2-11 16]
MRVHHLNCGSLAPPFRKLVNGDGGLFARAELVCHCLLVETGSGLVLVDTGVGIHPGATTGEFRRGMRPSMRASETAIEQVRALGFAPEDVRHIVVTHLDYDHAGGLRDFPWAKVHVHAAELDAATNARSLPERRRYLAATWSHGPDWATYRAGGDQWFGFDAVRGLDGLSEDVLLVPLAGHTRGHTGVAVRDGSRWLLHAGDAYFFRGEVDPRRPHCSPGLKVFQYLVGTDHAKRTANRDRLQQLASAHGSEIEIFSAHDPEELRRYR